MQSPLQPYADAIGQIESGGDYNAIGPLTQSGDRAIGKYQVMGNNVPQWTKIALGQSMTPDEFRANPAAQDQVFNHFFGGALNKYGNSDDAASTWFSGGPLARNANKSDGYNTTTAYVKKFNDTLQQQGGGMPSNASAYAAPDQSNPILDALSGQAAPAPVAPQQGQPGSVADALSGFGNSLQGAGGWLLAANNPAGGAALVSAANNKQMELAKLRLAMRPQFSQIGTDINGKPQYGFVDLMNQKVTPASGTGSAGINDNDPISKAIATGATGEDLLNQPGIPEAWKAMVRGINQGTQPYNVARLANNPLLASLVEAYEPGANLTGRAAAARDWSTKSQELLRRANNVGSHGGTLVDNFMDLQNLDGIGPDNKIFNSVKNTAGDLLGNGAVTGTKQNITALANELGAFLRGNGGTDTAAAEWERNFPIDGSFAQKQSAMGTFYNLYTEALNNLDQKRTNSLGTYQSQKQGPLITPDMQASLDKIHAFATASQVKQVGGKNYFLVGNQWLQE